MSSTVRSVLVSLFLGAFIALLTSCGSNSTPSSSPAPSPVPPGTHLYMAVFPISGDAGEILQFDLPLASTSTPTVVVSTIFSNALAVDANGNIAAGDGFGHIAVFNAPLSDSSAPVVVFNNGTLTGTGDTGGNGNLVFDTAGELFVTRITPDFSSSVINRFTPPLASGSIPSQVITDSSLQSTLAAVLDGNGNLIVNNVGFDSSFSSLAVFEPPYTGGPLATPLQTTHYAGLAVSGNQLFVCNRDQQQVDVYNLPLTADSTPAFSITNGLNSPSSVAFDSSGNLYVGHVINLIESVRLFINVYSPPLSASSVPSVMMSGPGQGGVPFVTGGLTVATGK